MAADGGIAPALLLSKWDLTDDENLAGMIAAVRETGIDCPVIPFSNETGEGLDEVRQALEAGRTYCLLGSSGVGKTTLLNQLLGRHAFETSLVREKDGRGRHTTTRRQLTVLDQGAMIIDTPGMRELGALGAGAGIDGSFSDIIRLSEGCRFTDCTHTAEDGCAVRESVRAGELDEGHYQSYLKLRAESEFHEMSYLEKRKKDRQTGRFLKSAKKQIRHR